MSRADEELQGAEDKLNHLSMVKSKLEQTLDDLEDTLDREKRSKAEAEKTMRKMETDMKVHTYTFFKEIMHHPYLKETFGLKLFSIKDTQLLLVVVIHGKI